ncbi:MAG TPA: hypothetical protein VIM63_06530 [Rhodoferax sp.]
MQKANEPANVSAIEKPSNSQLVVLFANICGSTFPTAELALHAAGAMQAAVDETELRCHDQSVTVNWER